MTVGHMCDAQVKGERSSVGESLCPWLEMAVRVMCYVKQNRKIRH